MNQAIKSRRKVSIISGLCVQRDAISASAHDDALAFSQAEGFEAKIFSYRCEFSDVGTKIVNNLPELIFDQFFLESDLVLYHFGIYYELFNAIFLGNGRAKQVVRYHNLTPAELVPPGEARNMYRSRTQLCNVTAADAIWAVSEYNGRELVEAGLVSGDMVETIPLCVGDGFRKGSLRKKDRDLLRLLYVGRLVPAKGLLQLIDVANRLRRERIQFSIRVVGDERFSDKIFVTELKHKIRENNLEDAIVLVGGVSSSQLDEEYALAHILTLPSMHEGFCKPVVEAMASGCIPVTYDNSNLRYVASGYSRVVPTGRTDDFAQAILDIWSSLRASREVISIPVDAGNLSLEDYENGVDALVRSHGFPAIRIRLQRAAEELLQ